MLQAVPTNGHSAGISAWWRVVELCLPSHEGCGALTFRPEGAETLERDWHDWVGRIFLPALHPSLGALQAAAVSQDWPALLSADAALGASLGPEASAGSLAAGRHLLFSFQPPQGAKLLERLRAAAAENPQTGHLATVFVVRGHIFHLPMVEVGGALRLAECVLGAAAAGVTLPAGRTIDLLQAAADRVASAPAVQLLAV